MYTSKPTIQIKFPKVRHPCPMCGRHMMSTRISPEEPGYEQRTFECARCGEETILMATSAAIGRLH
jgi:predicted RNA-binding Zn-ribbon protein involved in translation (DUF1610 family)